MDVVQLAWVGFFFMLILLYCYSLITSINMKKNMMFQESMLERKNGDIGLCFVTDAMTS